MAWGQPALVDEPLTLLRVPLFLALFLVVRGAPVLLVRFFARIVRELSENLHPTRSTRPKSGVGRRTRWPRPDPEAYDMLKAGLSELELRFARPRDLEDPKITLAGATRPLRRVIVAVCDVAG